MTAACQGLGGHFFLLLKMVQVICNRDDRRLRRMQGGAVGAAASRT